MKIWSIFLIFLALGLGGCVSVPPEVVSLSSLTSNDTRALHDSYRSLVRKHFEALRKIREQEFSTGVLAPYIEEAIVEGRLIDIVQGKVVFDVSKDEFVKPDPAKASYQKLDSLNSWSKEVASVIESLRKEAFGDLVKQENDVLDSVDQAFGNVIRGDAAIHGYLLSVQKVDASQNEFLKSLGMEGLPKKIADSLGKASEDAEKNTARIKTAEEKAKKFITKAKGS